MQAPESTSVTAADEVSTVVVSDARKLAAERAAAAQKAAEGVNEFHDASEDLAKAEALRVDASDRRVAALIKMRDSGMRPNEMSEMTGLSTSRIRVLLG